MSAGTESTRLHSPPTRGVTTLMHRNAASPGRTEAVAASVNHQSVSHLTPSSVLSSPKSNHRHSIAVSSLTKRSFMKGQLSSQSLTSSPRKLLPPLCSPYSVAARRGRVSSAGNEQLLSAATTGYKLCFKIYAGKNAMSERARGAQKENDAMVYLDGAQVYTCGQCRTHLTSHDDIISKSFQGRHGRAYLFDQCVNVTIGKAEDRVLITGLHSVCDIFCKRCKTLVGWTYAKCYEPSQRYKERKYIIEKKFIYMEDSPNYDAIPPPAGERADRWRRRSMSWGTESSASSHSSLEKQSVEMVYEYPTTAKAQGRD